MPVEFIRTRKAPMPIYEYLAQACSRQPVCSRRKEYLQSMADPALTACRECGASIQRIMSSFAARSGAVGVSAPGPTPLNITGMPAPASMPVDEGGLCQGAHHHEP